MTRDTFDKWMSDNGYTDINDWNFQVNGGGVAYWIRQTESGLFALIYEQGHGSNGKRYDVRISEFNDFGCFTRTK